MHCPFKRSRSGYNVSPVTATGCISQLGTSEDTVEGGDKSFSEDVVLELAKPIVCLSTVYTSSNLHAGLRETRTSA
jgi:hypothetical protein